MGTIYWSKMISIYWSMTTILCGILHMTKYDYVVAKWTGWVIFLVRFILQIMYCLEMMYSSHGTIIFMYVSPYDDAQLNKSWHLIKSIWANAISSEPWIFSSTNMTFRDFSFPSNHHWRIHLALAFILYMAKSKNFHDMFVFTFLPISFNKWIPLDILELCFWI